MPELLNKSLLTGADGRSLGLQTVGLSLQKVTLRLVLGAPEEAGCLIYLITPDQKGSEQKLILPQRRRTFFSLEAIDIVRRGRFCLL